jgi:tRNA1(Val) A37 N6-methylase TrmN6
VTKADDPNGLLALTGGPDPVPAASPVADAAFQAAPEGYTIDAFHNGGFFLVQPSDAGHRAGMDAMLLAATIADGATGSLADLGAGAGAAGLAAANRIDALDILLVERAPEMADCARRTLLLPQNAHLAARARVLEADVSLRGRDRSAAGLPDSCHDYVIMNPPFNSGRDRTTPDPLKAQAHAMESPELFEQWLRTASAILKPGGQVSVIARPESLGDILAGCRRRFGGIEITPVLPRADGDAIRVLLTAIKGSRARLILRDSIVIHDKGRGRDFSQRMNDLANGRAAWPRRVGARAAKQR